VTLICNNRISDFLFDEVGNRTRAVESIFASSSISSEFHSPVSQAALPGGDNNGFETNPENALADDGVFTVDNGSGTNNISDCLDAGKDKHLYYDFAFDVGEGAVIEGIEVLLDAKADSTKNTPKMCVQLSWDGGMTWTAAQSTPTLSTAEVRYLLGGPTHTWGRSWSAGEFMDVNFQVRVINAASSKQRNFFLDWIAVKVHYQGSPMVNYAYDPLNRLTEASYNDGSYFHYSYDAVGNRLAETTSAGTTTYGYDIVNRLTSVDGPQPRADQFSLHHCSYGITDSRNPISPNFINLFIGSPTFL